jgi:CRISPR-associated protein Cas1
MKLDIKSLPRVEDRLSFVYLEKGRIERESNGLQFVNSKGKTSIPVATIASLLLGPGTTITHDAMKVIAECGCTVIWTGTRGAPVYASGMPPSSSSLLLLRQAELASHSESALRVACRMFEMRFGESPDVSSLGELRGLEAIRMKDGYRALSKKYGIEWKQRVTEGSWSDLDATNRCLSVAFSCCYALCQGAIHSLGLSPGIGFIHTGDPRSFVFDMADLYKLEVCVPIAFEQASESDEKAEAGIRKRFRDAAFAARLMERAREDAIELLKTQES